jgi:hypothetical protein
MRRTERSGDKLFVSSVKLGNNRTAARRDPLLGYLQDHGGLSLTIIGRRDV